MRKVTRFIVSSVLLVLVPSFAFFLYWESAEQQVERSGSVIPRNNREKIIFDYFSALKNKRYSEAYKYLNLAGDVFGGLSLADFIEEKEQKHPNLATKISIGEETDRSSEGDSCNYVYEVYEAQPDGAFTSGYVWLSSSPDEPGTCVISYKAVFGY